MELERIRTLFPDALWIDARSSDLYAAGHIPGALSLHESNWEHGFATLVEKWDGQRPLVVYCGGEDCQASDSVARRLRRELNFDGVHVLRGGWAAWLAATPGEGK